MPACRCGNPAVLTVGGFNPTGGTGDWAFGFIGFGIAAVTGCGIVMYDKKKKRKYKK